MEQVIAQQEITPKPVHYPFQCKVCARGILTKESLEEHMATHDKDLPCQYTSGDCIETFYTEDSVWGHMLSVHNIKFHTGMKVKIKCNQCDYRNTKKLVKIHMSRHSDVKNCVCTQCGKVLKTQTCLKIHMKLHAGPFEHGCTKCDKRFVSQGTLISHIRQVHDRQRVYCDECGNDFLSKAALSTHTSLHTGVKKYTCREGCEKTFRVLQTRIRHERSHRGVKEYKCWICPKKFMQRISLKYHIANHEGKKDYKCQTCNKAFVEPKQARKCKHNQNTR